MKKLDDKFSIQDSQYNFPYHYIPYFTSGGGVSLARRLGWGLEYLCYQQHLRAMVVAQKPESLLEVGCGDGCFLGSLPESIGVKVGIDLSERAIKMASAFHPNLDFRVQDLHQVSGVFDSIIAIEVLEHIPDDKITDFFVQASKKLSDNGVLTICVPTTNLPLNKKHYRHYNLALLEAQIAESCCGLSIEQVNYVYRDPWWFPFLRKLFDNRYFSIEIKSLMKFAWRKIWTKYRVVEENQGFHLIVSLRHL